MPIIPPRKQPKPKAPKMNYGKESDSFASPPPIRPGACRHCGAYPPCTPKSGKGS